MHDDEKQSAESLNEAVQTGRSGKPLEAVALLEQISAQYEARYGDAEGKIYCASSPAETLLYLAEYAKANPEGGAIVVSSNWADAYYYQAYFLVELGRVFVAKPLIERAVALSPRNIAYLSELGTICQRLGDWPAMLRACRMLEQAARQLSSDPQFLCRAYRGIAFALAEQNQFDEAEKTLLQCHDLASDARTLSQLAYIRARRGSTSA